VIEVGDLMQDLASRVAASVRSPEALREADEALAVAGGEQHAAALRSGAFIFATVHRAENREPAAIAEWPRILADSVEPGRPLILALHPGTRSALERAGVVLHPGIRVVEPLGYRTSLTLQLHAAAVLTDSGGIQRETAWLGTPCVVLRSTTEWVEAVDESDGRMVVTGLDRDRVVAALERLAPPITAEGSARERARLLDLAPAGAAMRIAEALAAN
jgi:UDP-N-acetylglucosamine 2-epimerase